ncbi:hypothetical protein [Actimicrobium sp. CCI2.3]|uniref:recombination directionality factor n=1 Tax=Actimicrobium sp. CCI2.3 TaxID=3048616 RepID=UPI002AB34BF3|nr:hypothetical protein [Actimicrobium sp. CCI2.3]MDY7574484.1 hypothetical protein [Actimicrobium sp. CCI2.3]MEB0023911.1 hypothetical protein [Actimicrobium sp. CCI2.3]
MATPNITVSGANNQPPSLLGQRTAALRTAGKIRAGIKVLTKNAAANPRAKSLYEHGVQTNRSFDDIARDITQAVPNLTIPLVPRNVPYFTVRPGDFPNPATAAQLLYAFGEDRGDGIRRLYRFPAIFPSDDWHTVMPHGLVAWGANDRRYWSQYSPDGQVRHCMTYAPVPRDPDSKRVIRIFGGRKAIPRADNGGICDPEHCPEYQHRQCNLSGRFVFFVPGIPSTDAFELPTNSFYAMNAAMQTFQTMAFLRGGRISGFLDDKRTPFYFTKKLTDITRIDDDGRPVRVAQWLIAIEAPCDVTALLHNDDDTLAIADAARSAEILEGKGDAQLVAEAPPEPEQETPAARPAQDTITTDDIIAFAEQIGIDAERYEQYANKRWGAGWKRNPQGRRRALNELRNFELEPGSLIDQIAHTIAPTADARLAEES